MAKTARRVKNLKRKYDGIADTNVNKYYEINPKGLYAIKKIMLKYNLQYDCELIDITIPLVDMYKSSTRELYALETTGQVLKILNYIRENKLLDGERE